MWTASSLVVGQTSTATVAGGGNPLHTGQVIDQNDIAVLRLSQKAPAFAASYGLYAAGDLTGLGCNIAGYGARSDLGGSVGTTPPDDLGVGRLRQSDYRYDFRYGDPAFGGFFGGFFGTAAKDYTYISDFDTASRRTMRAASLPPRSVPAARSSAISGAVRPRSARRAAAPAARRSSMPRSRRSPRSS